MIGQTRGESVKGSLSSSLSVSLVEFEEVLRLFDGSVKSDRLRLLLLN